MTQKQTIHAYYVQLLQTKMQELRQVLDELKEMGANETKSTAGDKHETALALLQIEQANKRAQLQQLEQLQEILRKINPLTVTAAVVTGSLVQTNQGYFYVSVALGKAIINGIEVTALSLQAPLGKALQHLKPGQTATFNNRNYIIETIS